MARHKTVEKHEQKRALLLTPEAIVRDIRHRIFLIERGLHNQDPEDGPALMVARRMLQVLAAQIEADVESYRLTQRPKYDPFLGPPHEEK